MTLTEFQRDFYCEFKTTQNYNHLEIISTAIRRIDDQIIDKVKTEINIHDTDDWIRDSYSPISLNTYSWQDVIEKTKRGQLDYFAMRAPIDNFFPLNSTLVPDINIFYIK